MKHILIPDINNKFYNNLSITKLPNINITSSIINKNIYSIYYRLPFDILIMPYSLIDNSIIQFGIEYPQIKIIIDLDIQNIESDFINTYKSIFTFMTMNPQNISTKTISIPIDLINDQIYSVNSPKIQKQNYIACFLDNLMNLPGDLEPYLYPKSNNKIRMFNNLNINHVQNLGLINEIDKAKILFEAKYYLTLNDLYLNEAVLSGCEILTLESLAKIMPQKQMTKKYNTYTELIKTIIS